MADMSDYYKIQIGCVVVYGNKLIGYGCNSNKTHPIQMKYNQYRNFNNTNSIIHKSHAEISAICPIRNLDIDWTKVSVYIYRKRKDKEFGLARPCNACREFLKSLNIKNIYYTGDDSYIYERLC